MTMKKMIIVDATKKETKETQTKSTYKRNNRGNERTEKTDTGDQVKEGQIVDYDIFARHLLLQLESHKSNFFFSQRRENHTKREEYNLHLIFQKSCSKGKYFFLQSKK